MSNMAENENDGRENKKEGLEWWGLWQLERYQEHSDKGDEQKECHEHADFIDAEAYHIPTDNNNSKVQIENATTREEVNHNFDSYINNSRGNIGPTVLSFSHITVTTRAKPRLVLLDDISGSIDGGFWAILGASGGGKTTLLSTLSLRLDPAYMEITGQFRLNGRTYSRQVLKAMSAYVMQDDLLHGELTVQETLSYAAQLRMSFPLTSSTSSQRLSSMTTAQSGGLGFKERERLRQQRIEEVLNLMELTHCRNTVIGNDQRKGISGGERKRVSIAMELLNRPKLLFLDEPTSGLDGQTAWSICVALKNLSSLSPIPECTVVCTIHQPQPKIFALFDNIILMRKGKIVYQGRLSSLALFLEESLGSPCPTDLPLADHVLEVIAPNSENERVNEVVKIPVPVNLSLGSDQPFYQDEGHRSWFSQFLILFRRNYFQYIRQRDIILLNLIATLALATFIGCGLWYQIGTDQSSIAKRIPSLFFTCITQGILGSLQAINSFPSERAIMLRERQAGTYQVSSYFAAKSCLDVLTQALWPPIVFSIMVYPLIGYQPSIEKFVIYTMFMCLDSMAATTMATLVTCFCVSVELSTVVLCLFFEVSRLFGGFFASPKQIASTVEWSFVDVLNYMKYVFVGVALNELDGLILSCNPGEKCQFTTGEEIAAFYGYSQYSTGFCVGMLLVLITGFRLLAYIGLRFIKT